MINKEMRQYPLIYTGPIGRTVIGWGAHATVADECKNANIKKALITTTGLKGTGIVDEIKGILEYNGVSTAIYNKVTSNNKDYQVMEAYKVFKEAECDGVVSVGGGSSHDNGKAVRLVACNDGKDIRDLAGGTPWGPSAVKLKPVTIPQVSVNTTAGTSAEITRLAMVLDTKLRKKQAAMAPGIVSTVALIDPLFVRMMPQHIAAWTGWDAFAHAFETFLGARLPEGEAVSLRAQQLVAENLREFAYNRMNHVACENMCYAESIFRCIEGMGEGFGGRMALHEVATQVGGMTDCHHGQSIAIITLPVQRLNETAVPERFGQMARAFGVDTRGMTKMQAADKWFDEVERMLADLGIKTGHLTEQVGLQKKDIKEVATRTAAFGTVGTPSDVAIDEIAKLLESLL